MQSARQAFETALTQAKAGDSEAASKLGELGNAYRQAGRTYYASSTDYASIDAGVRAALGSMADLIDKSSQTSAAQMQLTALDVQAKAMEAQGKTLSDSYNAQTALLDATVNTAAEEIALLTRLNDTLAASDGSVNGLIATQLASLDDLAKAMQHDGLNEVLAQSIASLPTEFAAKFVQYGAPSENRDLLRQQLDAAKQQLDDERRVTTGWWRCTTSKWNSSRRLMPGCGQSRTTPHWRGGRMTGYRYVVEITAAVDSSGTEQTFYVGSTGFTTLPTDTPAGTAIPPHLLNPGNYERSLFTGKRTFGAVSGNYGEVVIANHNSQYDGWIDYGFDGRRFRLYYGPEDAAYPSGYTLVLQCTMLSADFGLDAVRIKLRDRLSLLDAPVIGQSFAGTGGVEGSADQAGSPKPRLMGDTFLFRWSCWITVCNCISSTSLRPASRHPCPRCTTAALR